MGPIQLYDLSADKQERTNLASAKPEVVQQAQKFFASARTEHPKWPLTPRPWIKKTGKIGMSSRSRIILVLLLPILSLGKERPPNIVLFMAEDIGNDLACYGHPGVKTPTIDNLAAKGIRYERFYTNSPICSPSRTSLMLGVHQGYSGGHHHRSNGKRRPELHYLTHYLREVGYTCMVGTNMIPFKTSKIDVNVQLNEPMFDKKAKRSKDTPSFGKSNYKSLIARLTATAG